MRILFLDDCSERCRRFLAEFPHAVVVHSAKDAISALTYQAWDTVFLDHDLDMRPRAPGDEDNTGMEVVRFLCSSQPRPSIGLAVIHSHNDAMRPIMKQVLAEHGYLAVACEFSALWSPRISVIKLVRVASSFGLSRIARS